MVTTVQRQALANQADALKTAILALEVEGAPPPPAPPQPPPGPPIPPVPPPPVPPPPGPPANVENDIKLTNVSGAEVTNWPYSFARPLVAGEIPHFARPMVNGAAVPYHADPPDRWADGSAKHQKFALVISSFPATITFADTTTEPTPIVRTVPVVLALDAAAPTLAFFHAIGFPGSPLKRVRIGGENVNSETMKDVNSRVAMRNGTVELFAQDNVNIYAGTNFNKQFWIGGPAPEHRINVDHNIAYLAKTKFFANFDPAVKPHIPQKKFDIPEYGFSIGEIYEYWMSSPRGLYDTGIWRKYLPGAGGGNHIGFYNTSEAMWLYSGDWRMREVVEGSADLAGAWPLYCREGGAARKFDKAQTVPAIGKPVSVYARPNLWLFDSRGPLQDSITIKGPRLLGPDANGQPAESAGWIPDSAHQPDPYSVPYILTGDPFYLEQLQFWAAANVVGYDPAYKGPAPSGGIADPQLRGRSWTLRTRINAAFLSRDGTPEKAYFTEMADHAIAYAEGYSGVTGTQFDGHPLKVWARANNAMVHPLHFMQEQQISAGNGIDTIKVKTASPIWTQYFFITVLGLAKEKGFPTGPMLSYAGKLLIDQATTPGYDPLNLIRYFTPVRKTAGTLFATWPEVAAAFNTPTADWPIWHESYNVHCYAASTFLTKEPGGQAAHDWIKARWYDPKLYAKGPKWAFLPR